jgi:hypothetical protein
MAWRYASSSDDSSSRTRSLFRELSSARTGAHTVMRIRPSQTCFQRLQIRAPIGDGDSLLQTFRAAGAQPEHRVWVLHPHAMCLALPVPLIGSSCITAAWSTSRQRPCVHVAPKHRPCPESSHSPGPPTTIAPLPRSSDPRSTVHYVLRPSSQHAAGRTT